MTQDEWVTYQKEAYRYKNGDFPSDMSALLGKQAFTDAYNAGKWIDWVDEVSGNTATTQKYSLSVSSGTEKTRIFASTSYNREEGLLSNENLNRYSLRLNIDQQLFSWAKVGFTSNLVYRDLNSGVKTRLPVPSPLSRWGMPTMRKARSITNISQGSIRRWEIL